MPLGHNLISVGLCSLKDFVQYWTLWSERSWNLYYHQTNRSFQAFPLRSHGFDSSCPRLYLLCYFSSKEDRPGLPSLYYWKINGSFPCFMSWSLWIIHLSQLKQCLYLLCKRFCPSCPLLSFCNTKSNTEWGNCGYSITYCGDCKPACKNGCFCIMSRGFHVTCNMKY